MLCICALAPHQDREGPEISDSVLFFFPRPLNPESRGLSLICYGLDCGGIMLTSPNITTVVKVMMHSKQMWHLFADNFCDLILHILHFII